MAKFKVVLLLFLLSTPLLWKTNFISQYLLYLFFLLSLWILSWVIKNKYIGYFIRLLTLVFTIFVILESSGLINNKLQIDRERSFIVDSHFQDTIKRFQQKATYMDYRIRFKVWSSWIVPVAVAGRALRFAGGDVLIVVFGAGGLIFLIMSCLKKTAWWEIIVIFIGITAASLARNPNTDIFWFLLPPILKIWWNGINKLNNYLLYSLLIINYIYLFIP